jgi:hypothetical protein
MNYGKNGNFLTTYLLNPASDIINTVADQFTNRKLVLSGKKKKKRSSSNTIYGTYSKND